MMKVASLILFWTMPLLHHGEPAALARTMAIIAPRHGPGTGDPSQTGLRAILDEEEAGDDSLHGLTTAGGLGSSAAPFPHHQAGLTSTLRPRLLGAGTSPLNRPLRC